MRGMKWRRRELDARLPLGGRDYNLLDLLLQPTRYIDQRTGETVQLFSTSQNIVRFWHLIQENEDD